MAGATQDKAAWPLPWLSSVYYGVRGSLTRRCKPASFGLTMLLLSQARPPTDCFDECQYLSGAAVSPSGARNVPAVHRPQGYAPTTQCLPVQAPGLRKRVRSSIPSSRFVTHCISGYTKDGDGLLHVLPRANRASPFGDSPKWWALSGK